MRTMAVMVAASILMMAPAVEARVARRTARCCVTIHDPDGTERPYCFVVKARSGSLGPRRVCRLLGGRPARRIES